MAAEPLTTLSPAEAAVLAKILGAAPGGELLTAGLPVAATEADSGVPSATTLPEVSFLTTRIPPPAPLYLTREDVVQVELYNSVSNAAISVGARFLRPDGVIVPVVRDFRPTADRSRNVFTLDLGEGYLLGLHFGTSAVTQPGQAYALEGTLLEACNCNVLCPCRIGEDPDNGTCDSVIAYHIDRPRSVAWTYPV